MSFSGVVLKGNLLASGFAGKPKKKTVHVRGSPFDKPVCVRCVGVADLAAEAAGVPKRGKGRAQSAQMWMNDRWRACKNQLAANVDFGLVNPRLVGNYAPTPLLIMWMVAKPNSQHEMKP